MAEVLVEFSDLVVDGDGITYVARAWGAPCSPDGESGLWEGWVEFVPTDGGESVHSGRETTQPNRIDTLYWATGLTPVYLEGALDRALRPAVPHVPRPTSILNPFSAYRNGEVMLRRQLAALSPRHLINIATAHDLADRTEDLHQLTSPELIDVIVDGVSRQLIAR